MDADSQRTLIERVLALIERGSKDMDDAISSIAAASYVDPARLERETSALFRHLPLILGRSSEVPRPGDYVTHELTGAPILITRDPEGRAHAMLNVCRHRGTRVAAGACGHTTRFVCPYHAWTYGSDGALLRVTDGDGFPGVSAETHSLVPLPIAERHGFLWVVAAPDRPLSIADHLGALDHDFTALQLESHVRHEPRTFDKAINWKLAVDIFLEAYHVRYVHAKSIYPIFHDNLGLFDLVGPHQRNIFPKRTIVDLAETDPSAWRLRAHANVLYLIFPSSLMLVQPDHLSFFTVHPRGTDACTIEHYTLLPEAATTEKAIEHYRRNIEILHAAIEEDFAMGESIQRGLRSGANDRLTFGRFEQSLTRFHGAVERALGRGEAPSSP
jgi:phenylpropionate dioxygenase-like ring-hydroxylating dioxygenase large terminal subunit